MVDVRLEETTFEAVRALCQSQAPAVDLPIEQTAAWRDYQALVPGRRPWRQPCLILRGEQPIGLISLIDFQTHGYHYLRSQHGPVLFEPPSAQAEGEILTAIRDYVRAHDKAVVFLRLGAWSASGLTRPTLSAVPYDQTVVIDTTGGAEAILSRMKRRGRRDVRKALRESGASCADETTQALASFEEYYPVMVETAQRDGFHPADRDTYATMISSLGADHVRVFAARIEGRVAAWSIVTVNGCHAVRYYAAMRTDAMRAHITDQLVYQECVSLGEQGITGYDLMGIGSDFSPSLMGLNEFKTKFTEEVTAVAPDRDLPVRGLYYQALSLLKRLRH